MGKGMNLALLCARPVRYGRIDHRDGCTKCGWYIHFGRVKQVRIVRTAHGGCHTATITRVSRLDVGQHGGTINGFAIGFQLSGTPFGADLRGRGDIKLHIGIGADDRSDITPVQHRAPGLSSEIALKLQ